MDKNIVIVGGGISGLTLLHYLKQKYQDNDHVKITLLERNDSLGGTIQSIYKDDVLFETGPNGFLDSKPQTLELVKELDLESQLVRADDSAKLRFVSLNNQLHAYPTSPKDFLNSKLLNPLEKLRVFGDIIKPKGKTTNESVFEFGARRFGPRFAQLFLDPMVTGIYGGDAQKINLKAAFPRIHELEQEHGSLFRAMKKVKKAKQSNAGMPKGTLTSFKNGMGQLINALGTKYEADIRLNEDVRSVSYYEEQYVLYSNDQQIIANELYLSVPAYSAAKIVHTLDPSLSEHLEQVRYAPIVVVGLAFAKKDLQNLPEGFGYLIPSLEDRKALGVLFDHNIFSNRCLPDLVFFRVMLGGDRHPELVHQSQESLIQLAIDEVKQHFSIAKDPVQEFFVSWVNAIPQYDQEYVDTANHIKSSLQKWSDVHIVANYWRGISLNDCVENAYRAAQNSALN